MTKSSASVLDMPASDPSMFAALVQISSGAGEAQWDGLFAKVIRRCEEAFFGNPSLERKAMAEEDVHRTLYQLYAWRIACPWNPHWRNVDDSRFDRLRQILESAWAASEEALYAGFFGALPHAEDFPDWAQARCREHRSNVSHPLFSFLRDTATFAQLKEFIVQETPFDIHFGDILALMLPGVYGRFKTELSKNFWDEMGRGETALMHRQLRLDMTRALGVTDQVYLDVDRFCVEELRLANMYFHAVFNRSLLPQALGMLLATELMVPGRLDQQILGWRRAGLADESMRYLLEHTVVDVEHAHGWMNEVVMPLLADRPDLMGSIVLGMARRLEYAAAVCDRMMQLLPCESELQARV